MASGAGRRHTQGGGAKQRQPQQRQNQWQQQQRVEIGRVLRNEHETAEDGRMTVERQRHQGATRQPAPGNATTRDKGETTTTRDEENADAIEGEPGDRRETTDDGRSNKGNGTMMAPRAGRQHTQGGGTKQRLPQQRQNQQQQQQNKAGRDERASLVVAVSWRGGDKTNEKKRGDQRYDKGASVAVLKQLLCRRGIGGRGRGRRNGKRAAQSRKQ